VPVDDPGPPDPAADPAPSFLPDARGPGCRAAAATARPQCKRGIILCEGTPPTALERPDLPAHDATLPARDDPQTPFQCRQLSLRMMLSPVLPVLWM